MHTTVGHRNTGTSQVRCSGITITYKVDIGKKRGGHIGPEDFEGFANRGPSITATAGSYNKQSSRIESSGAINITYNIGTGSAGVYEEGRKDIPLASSLILSPNL